MYMIITPTQLRVGVFLFLRTKLFENCLSDWHRFFCVLCVYFSVYFRFPVEVDVNVNDILMKNCEGGVGFENDSGSSEAI